MDPLLKFRFSSKLRNMPPAVLSYIYKIAFFDGHYSF